jgi:hypothetical protein
MTGGAQSEELCKEKKEKDSKTGKIENKMSQMKKVVIEEDNNIETVA